MKPRHSYFLFATLFALVASADDANNDASRRRADQQALEPLGMLIGQWRGVGQPQRGSTKGAWIEQSDWAWQFEGGGAALVFSAPESKSLTSGALTRGEKEGEFHLNAKTAAGESVRYVGRQNEDGSLSLTAAKAPEDAPARVTIRQVADGKRLVVLYERRSGEDRFTRLAEIGYTRKGSGFGQGSSQIECVVTGGLGTIPVTYQNKTYYVCCTGCRDLFNDDPESVLADYRARKEEERKKRESENLQP
jgi:hypothetical protein